MQTVIVQAQVLLPVSCQTQILKQGNPSSSPSWLLPGSAGLWGGQLDLKEKSDTFIGFIIKVNKQPRLENEPHMYIHGKGGEAEQKVEFLPVRESFWQMWI